MNKRKVVPNHGCTDTGVEFIKCSLDPFGSDSARFPDGRGGMSTHIKLTQCVQMLPRTGSGTIVIGAFPNLPGGLVAIDGQFNGPDRGGNQQAVPVFPNSDNIIFPFIDYPSTVAAPAFVFANSANIHRARVVSYGMEVKQVGALLNQGGVAATGSFPLDLASYGVPQYIEPGNRSGTALTGTGDMLTKWIGDFPQSYQQLMTYPGVKMCSAMESCRLVGKPSAYEFSPMEPTTDESDAGGLETDMCLFTNGAIILSDGFGYTPPTTIAGGGGIPGSQSLTYMLPSSAADLGLFSSFWHDPNCEMLVWAAQDLSSTNSLFEVTFHLCIEVQISHKTSIYRPFISRAPTRDERAINIVAKLQNELPPSLPAPGADANWWQRMASAVSGIGDVAASLAIPVVSPIAAITSKVAKLFM